MSLVPDLSSFEKLCSQHELVPVYRRLLSDALTPVSAFRLLDEPLACGCLFESVIGGEKVGRYSMIAIHPRKRIVAHGKVVSIFQGKAVLRSRWRIRLISS